MAATESPGRSQATGGSRGITREPAASCQIIRQQDRDRTRSFPDKRVHRDPMACATSNGVQLADPSAYTAWIPFYRRASR